MGMVKIMMVMGALIACSACGGAPFSVGPEGTSVVAADASPSTADAGQTSAEDAGAQATRDAIVVAPDANTVPDAMSAKQPEEAATHEAGPPDADQPDAAVPLCGGEATRCFDGTTVQTCESLGGLTSWGNLIACQGVCLNGACVACDPGGDPVGCTGCNGNAGTQTCGATGVWSPCSTSCSG
jgi:hypothetical protein